MISEGCESIPNLDIEMEVIMLTVSKDASGDFSTLCDALEALSDNPSLPREIFIKNGIYEERPEIRLSHLTIIGEDVQNTIITFGYGAFMPMEDGSKRGTFRSYTMLIDANSVTIKNLTIANHAGSGEIAGQAIALYADGDKLIFENCRLLGHQDTLFTGPLPPEAKEKGGFTGPKEFDPRIVGHQYYKNCYIEGDVDFIFGSACAFFDHCTLHSLNRCQPVNGFVTAASTPKEEPFGYFFSHCNFTSECEKETVYLGRPWREFAKTVLFECHLGDHIKKEGWNDWNKPHSTVFYAEYHCDGAGADYSKRPDWIHLLTEEEANAYRLSVVRLFTFALQPQS